MSFFTRWQDNMIFYPVPPNPATFSAYQAQEISVNHDGIRLQGWEILNPDSSHPKTLLYFGGNAEDITFNFETVKLLGVSRAFFFNYRGYGNSEGKPSQHALYSDALHIYDSLLQDNKVDNNQLILVGRSLGSSVATYLAAKRDVSKVILITPFDSIKAIAQGLFPFLPVKWFLRHPFPSDEYAPHINTPLLMVAAENDEVIPNKHSERLYSLWAGKKQWQLLEGVGHNDIQLHPFYYPMIREFILSE